MKKLFKNWPEICKIGKSNPLLMLLIASMDTNKLTELSERVINALPEFFSEKEIQGPVPLSIIKSKTMQEWCNETGINPTEDASRCPESHCVLEDLGLPRMIFVCSGEEVIEKNGEMRMPKEILDQYTENTKQWDIFTYQGVKIVLAEYRSGDSQYNDCPIDYFVPLECIALDL